MGTLKVGDSIPQFSLYDQDAKLIDSNDLLDSGNLVLYFYPKNNTPGCTAEACSFRDNIDEFNNVEAIVIGISSDSVRSHKRFAEEYNLNFRLLSDKGGKVRKMFGAKSGLLGLIDDRITFIVNGNGEIIHITKSLLNPVKHIKESIKFLRQ